ncbi:hypothetical protein PC129_g24257 [Phytophthora cactorum]|uniref:Uncharacterized protein n=2 Tax=Phytophthora cactorum TaxID=29920 RepID=A0A329RA56_9STRA|nr:hypothetical protein Pcac1_g6690 [Phytophthora cactorum]KAG2785923.1 hypothetical protein PC111_g24340 [Phytophthora cactorum]KAG2870600.1 hypothetical protein PC114_g27311 [Phytophthora cactorum]KAG2876584.1 hypothetical protein PC117_g27217 [Phytophthora cactorum]KAG2956250.1 hypothetical protein PC118_g24550 [Phytophthora cactorum]
MHYCPMDSQSSSFAVSPALQPRVLSHKRRRNGAFTAASSPVKLEEECDVGQSSASESCCTTSGESSSDESDSSYEVEEDIEEEEEEEALVAAKRRRRADLDGLKKSVRHMEAQVVDASVQLRDLAALVAQVVARRQHQQLHA